MYETNAIDFVKQYWDTLVNKTKMVKPKTVGMIGDNKKIIFDILILQV